jgi:hypothetical protein
MSEELNTMRAEEYFEDLYGVDGDGLGEGEVAYEGEFSWPFSLLGVLERVRTGLQEARNMPSCGGLRSRSLRAQDR